MARVDRLAGCLAVAMLVTACTIGACGGSGSRAHPRRAITLLMATAPDSLDPGVAASQQALEADWLVYTPLLTYAHTGGVAGSHVVAGLASDLPTVSDGGRLYTLTLRPGLTYSNGRTVQASDFARAVERAIRLRWPNARDLLVSRIRGAAAFARGAATSISGITTDDALGQITIGLTKPDGSFENVLALPALAPVPPGTPFRNEPRGPPPGVGPYKLVRVRPGRSFWLVANPLWKSLKVPGIPAGKVDVHVKIRRGAGADVRSVIEGRADVLDSSDPVSPGAAAEAIRPLKVANATYLIFLDTTRKPFSSQLARQAVATALDAGAMSRLDGGAVLPGCYVLPPGIVGHPSTPCPNGDPARGGDIAAARGLVQQSGLAGTQVMVANGAESPLRQWTGVYASLLNAIGFEARVTLHGAQTGVGALYQVLPNPAAFYRALVEMGVDDPYIDAQVRTLRAVPAGVLSAVADLWQDLEEYTASKAYVAVIGYPTVPEIVSARMDPKALIFNPVVGYDWSSFRLK